MQYILLRDARFDGMWLPGARLAAGEVLLVCDRESECSALVPRPLDVERCVKAYLNREWQGGVQYWTESVAAAEAYLKDPQEDGREIDLGDPHEVLRKGHRFLERHATRPETLLEWLTRECELGLPCVEAEMKALRRRLDDPQLDESEREWLETDLDDRARSARRPDETSVAELRADPDMQFNGQPGLLDEEAGTDDRERFGETYTLGVLLTSADQLFSEIEAAYRRSCAKDSSLRHHWMLSDFYEDVVDRLLRLPDDTRSPDRVEREILKLERRVNKLVKLTDQEAEWLLEDRLK